MKVSGTLPDRRIPCSFMQRIQDCRRSQSCVAVCLRLPCCWQAARILQYQQEYNPSTCTYYDVSAVQPGPVFSAADPTAPVSLSTAPTSSSLLSALEMSAIMPMSPSQFLPASLTSSPGRRSAGGNTPAASSSHTRPEAVMTSAARNPSSVRGVASNTSDMYQRSVVVEGVPSYPERRAVEDHRPPVRSPSPFLPSTVQSRLPTRGLNDDEVWWVVLEGAQPGAYLGR